MENRTALIAGATGLVGRYCLERLLALSEYDRVVVLTRRPLAVRHAKLDNRVVDFETLSSLDTVSCDDVFCCLGTTIKQAGSREAFRRVDFDYCLALAKYAKACGAKHCLLISAIGANARSMVFYSRVKGELEQAILALHYEAFSIFQPSLLVGDREESRPFEKMAMRVSNIGSSWMLGPLKAYRPIAATLDVG